ncbi:MAG: hypothetical protein IKD28_01615, partial [Clostridia bacterium]|nr:hypothetical protein [Clostridia bacterium]
MKLHLITNGNDLHAGLFKTRIEERIPVTYTADGMALELCIDEAIGKPESYQIAEKDGKWMVVGSDTLGLFYGVGKLLHAAKWGKECFTPVATEGVVTAACDFRAVYFAIHFYNWYQNAPVEELTRYLEDLLLWGYNAIVVILPIINIDSFEDELLKTSRDNAVRVFTIAKRFGMRTGIIFESNQGMRSAPHELDAEISFDLTFRGNAGRNLCISKPETVEYVKDIWRKTMECFTEVGLDYALIWPYDEGGCGCKDCRPWGANGYCKSVRLFIDEVKKNYPEAKIIVSTWAFDMPNDEGEYAGLYRHLRQDLADVDYLMVDAHGDFPKYPLTHEVIKPIINFPEISMWGLAPWGGFGANPLPERFQRIWDSSKHLLSGGMPYSEGIYEDVLKVQCGGYYWHPDRHYRDILAEYISYEYSAEVVEDCLELMRLIEINHTHIGEDEMPDMAVANKALALAKSIDARLDERAKKAWRWRILYIRAVVDQKRYQALVDDPSDDPKKIVRFHYYSGDRLLDDAEAQELFHELWKHYHCVPRNGENHHTLPPYGGTKLDVVV